MIEFKVLEEAGVCLSLGHEHEKTSTGAGSKKTKVSMCWNCLIKPLISEVTEHLTAIKMLQMLFRIIQISNT